MISRLVLAALCVLCLHPAAAAPRVVVSIKPLEGIVVGLMEGVGRPHLLLPGGASPHRYSLRPSDARALRRAQLVVWIGPVLETFLVKPLQALGGNAQRVTLAAVPRLIRHRVRAGGVWEIHDHGSHGDHDRHDHDHKEPRKIPGRDLDGHIWMDPRNGMLFARVIAQHLIKVDPANTEKYRQNLAAALKRIRIADQRARAILAPVRRRPYIVFHDAFQYFEKRYRLAGAGSITIEGRTPGARRLYNIRSRILKQRVRCVFTEPQFPPRLARTVVAGTQQRLAKSIPSAPNCAGSRVTTRA